MGLTDTVKKALETAVPHPELKDKEIKLITKQFKTLKEQFTDHEHSLMFVYSQGRFMGETTVTKRHSHKFDLAVGAQGEVSGFSDQAYDPETQTFHRHELRIDGMPLIKDPTTGDSVTTRQRSIVKIEINKASHQKPFNADGTCPEGYKPDGNHCVLKNDTENIEKPFPNEHACRLKSPGQFDRFRRDNEFGQVDGKRIDGIFGIKERGADDEVELQAIRYPKDVWSAGDARSDCTNRDGTLFEPAINKIWSPPENSVLIELFFWGPKFASSEHVDTWLGLHKIEADVTELGDLEFIARIRPNGDRYTHMQREELEMGVDAILGVSR